MVEIASVWPINLVKERYEHIEEADQCPRMLPDEEVGDEDEEAAQVVRETSSDEF